LDQVVAGGSNLLVAVLAARTLGPSGFGLFSIAFTVYVTAQGASRAMVGEPLLIHPKEIEERTGEAIASGVVLGVAFALVVAAGAALTSIWSSGLAWSLLVLAVAMPALVLQDQGRYLGFALQRPVLSLVLDSVWLVLMIAALAVLFVLDHRGLVWFVAAWAGSGAVSGLLVFGQHVATHSLRSMRPRLAWLRETWSYAWRYLAAFSVAQIGALGTSIGLVSVIGTRGLGGVQGAILLTRPTLTVQAASVAAGVAEVARTEDADQFRRHVRRTTSFTVVAALLNGIVLLLLPGPVGRFVLGDTWAVAKPLLLPAVIQLVLLTCNSGAKAGLLGRKGVGTVVWIEAIGTTTAVSAAIVGGVMNGALGAMWGRALAWIAILALWWVVFRMHGRRSAVTIAGAEGPRHDAAPIDEPGVP
ncbi:MAG TPA: hypothetical protein VF426_06190, partial [Marmoricola sp.]